MYLVAVAGVVVESLNGASVAWQISWVANEATSTANAGPCLQGHERTREAARWNAWHDYEVHCEMILEAASLAWVTFLVDHCNSPRLVGDEVHPEIDPFAPQSMIVVLAARMWIRNTWTEF
jgi:hypothetical protein